MVAKNTPALPASVDRQTRAAIEKLSEVVDTGAGVRGRPEDRYIRISDLLNLGLAKKLGSGAQRLVSGENLVSGSAPNLTIPPKPENVEVRGGIGIIFITWDNVREQYANHALTEIWRSESDDIGSAVMIGQTALGFIFADGNVDHTKTYYYWIRFVSDANITGPWNSNAGTIGQCQQDPAEILDLLTGEIRESQLHQSLLEPIQSINAPGGLLDQINGVSMGLILESQNRALAILAEAESRVAQIQAETDARALALQEEAAARGAAITAVQTAQQTVNDSVASQLTTVTAATNANTAGLQTEVSTRTNQFNSLSQQMSTLTAGTNNQFDHAEIWYFDGGIESWTGNGTPTAANDGWLRPANHASEPYVSPPAISVDGSKYTQVRLRIKKTGTPAWLGELRWITTTDGTYEATNKKVAVAEPSYDANGIANLTFALSGTHWVGKTVSGLRLYLSGAQTASNYFEIDWVAVGRPAPGASSAALSDLQQTVADNYSALSQSITNTNATVANKAESSAVNALASRVTTAENNIVSQSNSLTNVQASLLNSAAIPTDFTNGLGDWTRVRHGAPTTVASATGTLVTDAELGRAVEINTFATAGSSLLTKGVVRVSPGRIYEVRARLKIVSSDGSVAFNVIAAMMPGDFSASLSPNFVGASAVTIANNNVVELTARFSTAGAAGVVALTAGTLFFRYGLRLSTAESGLVFRVGLITCVDVTDVNTLLGLSQANADATSLLDARVVQTEQAITAQSTLANNLKSSLYPSCIIDNPTFIDWPTGQARPTGWLAFGTVAPGRHTGSYAFTGGNAAEFVTGTNNAGMYFDTSTAKAIDSSYFDVELTFTITAGTSLSGAGVVVRWYATDATFVSVPIRLMEIYPNGTFALNKKYTVSVRVKKPTVVGKTFSFNRVYLMANYSSEGMGALTSKTIIFDSVLVLISDASADALQTLDTRVTAAEGNLASQSSSITALQSSVANKAESSAVNALTTRVTAAEGSITSQSNSITQLQASIPGGGNLLQNTDFKDGTTGWGVFYSAMSATNSGIDFFSWVIPNAKAYHIQGNASSSSSYFDIRSANTAGYRVPVVSGKKYSASAYVGTSNVGYLRVYLLWYGATGNSLGNSSVTITSLASVVNTTLGGLVRANLIATAPENAEYAIVYYRFYANGANQVTAKVVCPMVCEVGAAVTEAPPYSTGANTEQVAAVKVTAEAAASTANGAVARWEVKTTVGALTGGVGFLNDGTKTRFAVHADQAYFYSPGATSFTMVVEGGKVVMDGAHIKNASIQNAAIANLNVNKLNGNLAAFVAANIGTAIINDANIGTLTVDKIIQTNASEDIIASSTVPITLAMQSEYSSAVMGIRVLSFTVPATTKDRKYFGTFSCRLRSYIAGATRVRVFGYVKELGTKTPNSVITGWATSGTNGWGFLATSMNTPSVIGWQFFNSNANNYAAPANFSNATAGKMIVAKEGSAIRMIGKVFSTTAPYVITVAGQYRHYCAINLSEVMIISTGNITSIEIYNVGNHPYKYLDAVDHTAVFNGSNDVTYLRSLIFDIPRGNVTRDIQLAVSVVNESPNNICESCELSYVGIR